MSSPEKPAAVPWQQVSPGARCIFYDGAVPIRRDQFSTLTIGETLQSAVAPDSRAGVEKIFKLMRALEVREPDNVAIMQERIVQQCLLSLGIHTAHKLHGGGEREEAQFWGQLGRAYD
mgnify:CR=1 FL=1